MSRKYRCKCKATGEIGNTVDFIKTEDGYFKDNEVYRKWKEEQELKKQENKKRLNIINLITHRYLKYPEGSKPPSYIAKKIKEVEAYGYDAILKTIQVSDDDIKWALDHKDFAKDSFCVNYIFAIISNNIGKVYRALQKDKRQEEEVKRQMSKETLASKLMVEDLNLEQSQCSLNRNKNLKKYLDLEEDEY